jgi:sRNA-binding carbon storage regulator CsrA
MYVVRRKPGETVMVGEAAITVDAPCAVRLQIEAPPHVLVYRKEDTRPRVDQPPSISREMERPR